MVSLTVKRPFFLTTSLSFCCCSVHKPNKHPGTLTICGLHTVRLARLQILRKTLQAEREFAGEWLRWNTSLCANHIKYLEWLWWNIGILWERWDERDVPGKWWGSWGDCAGAVRWGAAPAEDNLPSFSFSLVLVAVLQGVSLTGVLNLTQSVRSATLLTVHTVFSAAHCRWSFQWFSWYCSSCFDSCCDSFPRTYNYWGCVRSREFSYTVCVRSREFSYTVCVRSREFSYTAVYD